MTDRKTDVVAENGPDEAEQEYEHDVEPAGPGIYGRKDQDRLPRHWDAKVLYQHQRQDGQVAVVVERRLQGVQRPRQMLCGHGGDHRSQAPVSGGVSHVARTAARTR